LTFFYKAFVAWKWVSSILWLCFNREYHKTHQWFGTTMPYFHKKLITSYVKYRSRMKLIVLVFYSISLHKWLICYSCVPLGNNLLMYTTIIDHLLEILDGFTKIFKASMHIRTFYILCVTLSIRNYKLSFDFLTT
jgi:hypothetical protein